MAEDDSKLPPLDSPPTAPGAPAPIATEEAENVPQPAKINNKRKRNPVAMKSVGRRPPPRLSAPPKKKQRIMEGETPAFLKKKKQSDPIYEEEDEIQEDFLPPDIEAPDIEADARFQNFPAVDIQFSLPPNGVLQGGMGDGIPAAVVGDAGENFEGGCVLEECPFTEEEMNAPLLLPGANDLSEAAQHDQSYNPYVYDQGFDFDSGRQGFDADWDDGDDFYEPQQRKPRKPSKKRNSTGRRRGRPLKTIRNSATVSLSALLENSDGVDPQYCKERKTFYTSLETFMKASPDVNLLCGAPVDLYQLYTETYNRGGFDAVCQAKQWRQIFRQLPQYSSTHTSASYALKKMYKKNLLDYEKAQRNGFS